MPDVLWIDTVPPEIFLHIFSYLPVNQLMRCREVSSRWREIIDEVAGSDIFWKKQCEVDFAKVCKIARKKSRNMDWCGIYRSLSLWAKLGEANENLDEFCSAVQVQYEIRNCIILRDGVLGIHQRGAIVYYDIETLKQLPRSPIGGSFLKYSENDDVIAVLTYHLQLFIKRRLSNKTENASNDNVKTFLLLDHALYHVSLNDDLYVYRFGNKGLVNEFLVHSNNSIVAMGYTNNQLQILTFDRTIYNVVGSKLSFVASLGANSNILHQLHQYNFLELLDWRIYFQWMFILNRSIPEGPLQDIVTTRMYGDVIFVGTNLGVLRIYYKPYTLDQFDLFNADPVKQYNFMERSDCPVLCMCPILNVDAMEVADGHTVIVAMPKKIAIISFTHNFKRMFSASSKEMASNPEMEMVKIIPVD